MDLETLKRAVARVTASAGEPVGTAFLISGDLALTALHVVAVVDKGVPVFFKNIRLTFSDGAETEAEVVSGFYDIAGDWAILRCKTPPAVQPIELRGAAAVDERWRSFGYPEIKSDGMTLGGKIKDPHARYDGNLVIELSCEEAEAGSGARLHGCSGAPCVVNGAAIGVLRSTLVEEVLEGGRKRSLHTVAGRVYATPGSSIVRFQVAHGLPRVPRTRSTLVRSVYLIGGVTGETEYPDFEASELGTMSNSLGRAVANSGAELVVCSPVNDSADHHAVLGYVQAAVGGKVHFHSPRGEYVVRMRTQLDKMLGRHDTRILDYDYPGPEDPNDKEQWGQAWLLCQLQALERADVVIAIGGRLSKSASTLLHIAEARRIPILPFAFLGGAAARLYNRRDWGTLYPGLDHNAFLQKEMVNRAMELADQLVAQRMRGVRLGAEPTTFFISRAQQDREIGEQLAGFLRLNGRKPLLGDDEIQGERMVQASIDDAILRADVCVILWSKSYALSPWCSDELELALQRESAGALKIWLFSLDDTDIVPRAARRLPQAVVVTPKSLTEAVTSLLRSSP